MTTSQTRASATELADHAITAYGQARETYAAMAFREALLTDRTPVLEAELVAKLLGTDNPLTSTADKPKPHSASSAGEAIKTAPALLEHREHLRDAVFAKNTAYAAAAAAKMRAKLATAVLRSLPREQAALV